MIANYTALGSFSWLNDVAERMKLLADKTTHRKTQTFDTDENQLATHLFQNAL